MELKFESLPMVITDEERVLRASLIIYHESERKNVEALGYCMAASTDTFKACKEMLFAFGYGSSATFDQQKAAIEAAEKAITKAKGRT